MQNETEGRGERHEKVVKLKAEGSRHLPGNSQLSLFQETEAFSVFPTERGSCPLPPALGQRGQGSLLKDSAFSADATETAGLLLLLARGHLGMEETAHDPRALRSLPKNSTRPPSLLSTSDEEGCP